MEKWTSVPGPLTRGSFVGLFENHLEERLLDQALDITFLRGVGGLGGGVKSFCSEASKQWGRLSPTHSCWSNGNAAGGKFSVGGSKPGRLTFGGGGGGVKFALQGFEPLTKKAPVGCTTTRSLLGLSRRVSPLLGAASATDQKPMR